MASNIDQEHQLGLDPEAVIAVLLPIDHKFLLGFSVQSYTNNGIFLALVVPITT